MGCPSQGRFADNGAGTVTDTCTGLMWQKETADVSGDGQSTDEDSVPWCATLEYCENSSFAGHDDWRLPNVRELQGIVNYGQFRPSIDPVFGALLSFNYCSSTSDDGGPASAWQLDFIVGVVYNVRKGNDGYVHVAVSMLRLVPGRARQLVGLRGGRRATVRSTWSDWELFSVGFLSLRKRRK